MICIHHNDLDGKCAAAIVKRAMKPLLPVFIEADYKDSLPGHGIIGGENVVIVDFSYKPEDMKEIIKNASSIIWIDHHETAKDYFYQDLPGLRDFSDKGMSGCELTWAYYYPDKPAPRVVRLIGDYDKWSLQMLDSKVFYEGMKLLENKPESEIWNDLLADFTPDIEAIIKAGRTAIIYRDNYCNELCNAFGYETEINGRRAYACNQYMFGSGGFGHRFAQYPLCVAYIYDGKKFTVSLYSETVDVGEIAKSHGGGGHKGASGFVCSELPFVKCERK